MPVPNVLDEKILNKQENYLYSVLKYKDSLPKLVGTGSILSQAFPADIDLLCPVTNKPLGYAELQRQFKAIFKRISNYPNLFFVEFKLQNIDKDDKYKFYSLSDVDSSFFKDHYDSNKIDLCKIDLLQYMGDHFKEVSCIYFFNPVKVDLKKYIDDLLADQKHYYDEGSYYKSLKRFMLCCKLQNPPNLNVIIGITKLFNSAAGYVYQLNNHILACLIYMDKYGIDDRVKYFIKSIGYKNLNPLKLKDLSDDLAKLYNDEGLRFYKHFKIPVGKLLPYQYKRMGDLVGSGIFDSFLSGVAAPFRLVSDIVPGPWSIVAKVADKLNVPTVSEVINK